MSLTRPAAGGESCRAGFLSYRKLRFHTIKTLREDAHSAQGWMVAKATAPRRENVPCHILFLHGTQSRESCAVSAGVPHSSEQSVTHLSRAPSTPEAPDTTLLSITSGSVYERCTVSATARFCECSLQSARCSTARQTAARYTPRAAPMAEA